MEAAGGDMVSGKAGSTGRASQAVPEIRLSRGTLVCVLLFLGGSVAGIAAYGTTEPLLVAALVFGSCRALMGLFGASDPFDRRAFAISFCTCWFWAGVAAIYAEVLHDPSQNDLDAAYFFETVTKGDASKLGILDLVFLQENGGAMLLWRTIYDAFSALGFEKGRYIGVAANTAMVAFSAVAGTRMVEALHGRDPRRLRRFTFLFPACGLFWMFGAIHLRDSAVLLSVTLLTLFWVRFLAVPGKGNLWKLVAASAVGFLAFGMLRTEFVFVPVAMLMAGLAAIFMGSSDRASRRRMLLWAAVVGLPFAVWVVIQLQSDLVQALLHGQETYNDLTAAESSQGSLGNSLIMNQPAPLRLVLGFVYLLVFPIPFWSGIQGGTAYHLFKTLHALFMYGLLPLAALSAHRVIRERSTIGAPALFLLLVVIGFALSISYTSLENRHFGAFLVSLLVLCTIPDPDDPRTGTAYVSLARKFLSSVFLVHLAWGILKAAA